MSILNQLASALDRRDEVPNQELAQQIADSNNKKAVAELVANLTNKDKGIQSDCIKTIYEIAERKPKMIAAHAREFIALLDNKNNRLVWGAMSALSAITLDNAEVLYNALPKIVDTADKGTVITKDHAVKILAALATIKEYKDTSITLLLEQILASPVNQLPTYAESAMPIIDASNKAAFIKILNTRLPDLIDLPTKYKRLEKVIKKMK